MSNYTPEDVDKLIKTLRTDLRANRPSKKSKKVKRTYGPKKKPFLNKTQRAIKYLEQRHMFFNPNKDMLSYLIGIAKKSRADQVLLDKMEKDLLDKM